MKLYPEKLTASLARGLAGLYLVSGDEPLLQQEICDEIRNKAKAEGFVERDLFHVEAGFDWQSLHYSLNSLSLFAEKKLIELRLSSAKQTEKAGAALMALAEAGDDLVVLISLPKLDAAAKRAKWFKSLEAVGTLIQVWPIEAKDLPRWLEQRFKRKQCSIDRDALLALAARVEGNLLAAVQEVDRLLLAAKTNTIGLAQVQGSVADHARYDVFQWLDALFMGKAARGLRVLNGLHQEGTEVLLITGVLSRELRSLIEILEDAADKNLSAALQSARIWPKRKPLVQKLLQRSSLGDLTALHSRLSEVDAMVKGAKAGDPWAVLAEISLALSGQTIAVSPLRDRHHG